MKKKIFSLILCLLFLAEQMGFAQNVAVLDVSSYLAQQHSAIALSNFRPLHLCYLQLKPNEDNFKLLIDKGSSKNFTQEGLQNDSKELLKYFLIGLTLPNSAFWVNLRPDSPEQIIDPLLGETDIGRILLEADLELKKDTALATSPATPEGAEYWDKLYKKAAELFGSENITIPTLTRPWIVPDEIILSETPDSAYIHKATLKVMLEQDYLKNDAVYNFKDERLKQLNEYSSQLIRELIIPKLNQEINTFKKYAALRQVYYSLILAQWFKVRFAYKQNPYSYLIESRDLAGLTSIEMYSKNTYFKAYQESFKNGEYNYKTPVYTPFGQSIRSYFSGGADLNLGNVIPAQFGGIAGTNANGTQVCVIASSRDEATLRNNPYLLAAEGKISLGELVVRITGNTLSDEEIQRRVQGVQEAHRVELDNEHGLGQRNPDGTYQKDEDKPYSHLGLRQKAKILQDAGFDQEQRRSLLEYGLAGRKKDIRSKQTYFDKFKKAILNFLSGGASEDVTEIKKLIEEADRQRGERIILPDSYLRFIAEHGKYLRVLSQEDTVRWDYLKGPDEYRITRALRVLSKLRLLGHGTLGFMNTEDNHDRKTAAGDIDFVGVVSLLKIILVGKMTESSVSEFVAERQNYFKYNANYYGPFFVILNPGNKESNLGEFSASDAHGDRFESISSELHYVYLLPRPEDKEFFIKAIERAIDERLITEEKAREAMSKLRTIDEFLEEHDLSDVEHLLGKSPTEHEHSVRLLRQNFEEYLSQPIEKMFDNLSWSARLAPWFNATCKIISETHKKIIVYYPGAGSDLLYALLATNGDTFIFVDKGNPSGKFIPDFIMKHGGKILSKKEGENMYYLRFWLLGKTRDLYYYYGTDAGDENQLPTILKNGYNVYIDRHFLANTYGGFMGDSKSLWRINLKYLLPKGFTITDYSVIEGMPESGLYRLGYTEGSGYDEETMYFNIYFPNSPATSSPGSVVEPQGPNAPGGIDFRSLPIVTQAIGNLSMNMEYSSIDQLANVNLDEEWKEIERLVSSGITPSTERIKNYIRVACVKGEIEKDTDKVISCVSDLFRQEEEKCCPAEPMLKNILVVLEANQSSAELSKVFLVAHP